MNPIRAIVLDFDGVILESNQAKTQAFEDLADLYPAYRSAMMRYHFENFSMPRHRKFEHYVHVLMGYPGDEGRVREMSDQFSGFVVSRVVNSPFVSGAEAFLGFFAEHLPLYLSSVTPQEELRRIVGMRRLERFFVEVFGDPPCSKPDAIRTVISSNQLAPAEVVFIGDSISDYRAASETGVEFVGRDSGQPFGDLDVELFSDMNEIGDALRRRMGIRA